MSDENKNELPVESGDTLDTAIDAAVDFALDQSVPPPIRKGFTEAAKRLGAALVESAAGHFERSSAEKWAETEARIKITETVNEQIVDQIKVDPQFPQRAAHSFARQILREQSNREKILGFTASILKRKKYDDSANQQADNEAKKTINEDWFNIFDKEASQKSEEDMQRRFAKVLAGEIVSPGSHSVKAVRVLGNMDQNIAKLFQKVCSMSVVLEDLYDKKVFDIRMLSLGKGPGQNELLEYGLSFADILMLNEYDLVVPNYDTRYKYDKCILKKEKNTANPFRHQGKYWILEPSPERVEKNELRLSGIQLSHVGSQLFHIIEQIPIQQYTKDLKEYFAKQQLSMAEVVIENWGQNIGWRVLPPEI